MVVSLDGHNKYPSQESYHIVPCNTTVLLHQMGIQLKSELFQMQIECPQSDDAFPTTDESSKSHTGSLIASLTFRGWDEAPFKNYVNLGCHELYRRVNQVTKIDLGIRIAGNDFIYGRKSCDNLLTFMFNSFEKVLRRVYYQIDQYIN